MQTARDLTGEAKATPEARRWFALGVAAIYGQAYRAAQARGDTAAMAALDPRRMPFRLTLPRRPPGPTAEGFRWQEAPAEIGFDPSNHEWLKLSPDASGLGFHYGASRRAAHVAVAVPADDGTAFVLTARAVARLDWAPRQVNSRIALPAAPVLGWPDPVDRTKLEVLLADDGEPRSDTRVVDAPDKLAKFLARGGLLPLDAGHPSIPDGAVRVAEIAPGLAAWPTVDVTGTRAFILQSAAMPPEFDQVREPDYGRKLGTLFSHAGQDRTDVHAAVFVLVRGRKVLAPGASDYLVKRILAAGPALSPDDEAQAAVLLEHAGHASAARTLLSDATRRQLASGNPMIAGTAGAAGLLRQVALARIDASPDWALEALRASLAFAAHDRGDAALVAKLASRPEAAELRERLATPPPPSLDVRLRRWKRGAAGLALLGALVALGAMLVAARRARATRLADLYGLGWRSAGERTLAFLTHPVARLRHVWVAYAPRSTRALVAAAALLAVGAVAVSTTASRLQERLAVFGDNPANDVLAQGDVWRALRERVDLGSEAPALVAACAAAERARAAALSGTPGAPPRITIQELQSAALDPLVVRRELVHTFVLTAFDPAAALARLRDALSPRLAPWVGARAAVPAATVLVALVTILASCTLVGGLLALFWLPLAVRPRLARPSR